MSSKQKPNEYKKAPAKCGCCHKCAIYIEGPRKGTCDYGGPFKGFQMEPDFDENLIRK